MRIPLSLSIAISGILLTACGSDSKKPPTEAVDYSHLSSTPQTEQPLILADETRLNEHLKNGLRLQLSGQGGGFGGGAPDAVAQPAAPPTAAEGDSAGRAADAGGAGFSDTNVHVQGVDEADYAKYDGQHWFIATYPQYQRYLTQSISPGVQIVATDPDSPNVEIVGKYDMDEDWGSISEMYLVQQRGVTSHLAAIRNQWGSVLPILPGRGDAIILPPPTAIAEPTATVDPAAPSPDTPVDSAGSAGTPADSTVTPVDSAGSPGRSTGAIDIGIWPGPVNSNVRLQLVDVQNPTDPQLDWDLRIDGALIDSRKIGDTLYLVTRYDPWLADLTYDFGDNEQRQNNESKLSSTNVEQLLPKYRIGDGEEQLLSRNCYMQENAESHHGLASLVHITAIDLTSQNVIDSQCLNSSVENLSMSTESLYLTGTVYTNDYRQETVIHKFDLTETGAKYAATGSVSGGLGWRSDPAFRLHEHEGDLRIVTSRWSGGDIDHNLFILEQDGNSLRTIAQLPNEAEPAPIGKPGEDIFSVRFQENRAYIVTFELIDPLYSIDLSDRLNPRVTGELEVPGFATYLHPVGDNYLFTLGQDSRDDGLALGLKAELIDVSGDTPEVVNTLIFGERGTQSEATSNLKALSFLSVGDDELRIALPISLFEGGDNSWRGDWQHTGLQLLHIQGLATDEARLEDAGVIIAERANSSQNYPNHGIHRGILHDNAVFYTHNNAVWAAHWHDPENAIGPIAPDPIPCTLEYRYGLTVQVSLEGDDAQDQELDACQALVTATDGDYQEILVPFGEPEQNSNSCQFHGAGERPGNYLLETSFPGFTSNLQRVNVGSDMCHVIGERVDVVLYDNDAVICTGVLVPSLRVDLLLADDGNNACDAQVVAVQNGDRYPLEALIPPPSDDDARNSGSHCEFAGPHEVPGEMTLEVSLDGYATEQVDNIFVPHDECHVHTQHLRMELMPF